MPKTTHLHITQFQPTLIHALRPAEPEAITLVLVTRVLLRDRMPVPAASKLDLKQIRSSKPLVRADTPARHKVPTHDRTTPEFRTRRNLARRAQKAKKNGRIQAANDRQRAVTALRNSRRRTYGHSSF